MSKKSKKNNRNIVEELPSKSQCKMMSETLDKNFMDHTQFFSFIAEDFDELLSRSSDDVNEPLLEKIASDYKHLLQSSYISFWSTCSFNTYFQKSLDSFLKYAKKLRFSKYNILKKCDKKSNGDKCDQKFYESQFIKKNHKYLEWMQEIFRLVFRIYCRMSRSIERQTIAEKEIQTGKIIFENWLFDSVKALDLIAIFGENRECLKNILKGFYGLNSEYYDDFINFLVVLAKLLEKNVNSLVDIKKRERLLGESKVENQEIEARFVLLLNLLDLSYIFNDILGFFPYKCVENLFFDDKIIVFYENLYYEIDGYRNHIKPEEIKPEILPIISKIMDNIAVFFQGIFAFFIDSIAKKQITEINSKKFQMKLEKILINFGKMLFGSKKDPVNLILMRHLITKGFDLNDFLDKMPIFITLSGNDPEKISILLATFESLKEEVSRNDEEIIEENDEKSEENEEKIDEENSRKIDENEKKEEKCEKDEKDNKIAEKIKYTEVIVGKRDKNTEILSEKEQKAMASFIKTQMALEYEDEYDDTLEIYNEGKIFVEKNQLDPDSEEEYQITTNIVDYDDEKNDDFVRNYKGKTEFYEKNQEYNKPYRENTNNNYNKNYADNRDFNRNYQKKPYNNDNDYQKKPYNNDNDYQKKSYNNDNDYQKKPYDNDYQKNPYNNDKVYQKKPYNNDNEYFPKDYNKDFHKENDQKITKVYEKKTEITEEKTEKIEKYDKNEKEDRNEKEDKNEKEQPKSHNPGQNAYNNKKKYSQDKSFKNRASFKRKF